MARVASTRTVAVSGRVASTRTVAINSQNLLVRSDEFDNASWTKSLLSINPNAIAGPDVSELGGAMGDALVDTAANNVHLVQQSVSSITRATVAPVTISVYAKKGTRNFVFISADGGATTGVWFNLNTGALGSQVSATGTIEDVGSGWFRCSCRANLFGLQFAGDCRIFAADVNASATYAGGADEAIYILRAQVVIANWAGPPTLTTATAVANPLRSQP